MKRLLKSLRIILLVILILVVAVVVAIDLFADRALKIGIETAASRTLNVGVSVANVEISLLSGKIGFQNLVINNPPGYEHEKLLELKDAKIEVAVKSLLSDVVNIREIRLDGLDVVLEQRGVSGNNLQDIIKTISDGAGDKDRAKTPGKKLHIDNLEISNVTVRAKLLPVPGKKDTVTLKLLPIRMTDLGSDDKLDTAQLSSKILLAIANGVTRQGVDTLPKEMVNTMKLTLDKTMDLGKAASKEGKKIIDTGKDAGAEIIEGFKSLLKPKKNDK